MFENGVWLVGEAHQLVYQVRPSVVRELYHCNRRDHLAGDISGAAIGGSEHIHTGVLDVLPCGLLQSNPALSQGILGLAFSGCEGVFDSQTGGISDVRWCTVVDKLRGKRLEVIGKG